MKRLVCLLLFLLMLVPVTVGTASAAEDETIVRVLLTTNGADTLTVKLSGKYAVGSKTVTGGTVTAKISNGTITITHSSAGVLKTTDTVTRLKRVGTDDDTILTFNNPKHGTRKYYGDFVFYNDGGTLRLVNYVDMHNYLYGVVSGELSDSSKPDLLKTETICAKGFALAEVESRKDRYFDVYDTTTSQLYYGYVAEDTNTIAAVDAVWKQTLLYNGNVVKTYYSAANGGQVLSPRIRWGGTTNEGAYWFGYDPFDLAGSSKNVILTVDGKTPANINSALRSFLLEKTGAKEIVSVDALTGIYDPDNPDGTGRYPSTLAPQKRYDWTLTIKDSAGTQKQVAFSCTPDEVKAAAAVGATGTVCFAVQTGRQEWKLVWGVNNGHRAGLSHRGAEQMAKKGYSYVDILKFYYRGATLYDENGKAIPSTANFDFIYGEGDEPEPGTIRYYVIVTSDYLNLREGPSTSYAVIRELKLGTILGVYEENGSWFRVYDEGSGRTGYVYYDSVSYYERNPQPRWEGVCNANDSNIRSGPSTLFSRYWAINKGAKVYVYYTSGMWYYIMDRATGQGAFIWKNYITLGASVPSYVYGDANGSGTVTASDAALVLRYLVKLSDIPGKELLAADYSGDGTVNAEDAAMILRRVVGLD